MLRTFYLKTFGCQMNVHDSQRIKEILFCMGLNETKDLTHSDVIIVNTCSVREKAENKVFSYLGSIKEIKKSGERLLFVTGCMAERFGKEIFLRAPFVDFVLGPDQVVHLDKYLKNYSKKEKIVNVDFNDLFFSSERSFTKFRPSEFIAVMKGCNENCSYCVVPNVRGREKSRPLAEILKEAQNLSQNGTKEIIFLGQNINTYGDGISENLELLIKKASLISGIERIRYVTSHPKYLTDDLIEQFGKIDKLCPSLHLPVQSGSDRVLMRMNRHYTKKEYLTKIEKLRKMRPDIAISTDFIVGFSGETDEDFMESVKLAKEVSFSQGYLFKYSKRSGTLASTYEDLDEKIKKERLSILQETVFSIIEKENKNLIGSNVNVLIEGIDKKDKCYSGRDLHGKLVHVINGGPQLIGKLVDVKIIDARVSNLCGHII